MGCSSSSSSSPSGSSKFMQKLKGCCNWCNKINIKISESQAFTLSRPALVSRIPKQYLKTHYIQEFDKTSELEDLEEAVSELKSLVEDSGLKYQADQIQKIYEEEKSNLANCVTMIWTSDIVITALINCALVVDAVHTYPKINKDAFNFYFEFLEDRNLEYKTIISKYMKYMRILNTCIVTLGRDYNTADRKTYWNLSKTILPPSIEVGDTFRISNWLWTIESKQACEEFHQKYENKDQLMVEFRIEEGCFNAGRINKFGKSKDSTDETLIPPYTVVTLIKKEDDYAVLKVAKDNKHYHFDMDMSCAN